MEGIFGVSHAQSVNLTFWWKTLHVSVKYPSLVITWECIMTHEIKIIEEEGEGHIMIHVS